MSRPVRAPAAPQDPSLGELGLNQFEPYLMNRIMGRYNADLQEALKDRGLSTVQMRALAVIAVKPGLTINELAVYAVTEQSTMSRTLDGLEALGLIRRVASDADARARAVSLTDAGHDAFAEAWPLMRAARGRMMEGVAAEEQAVFVATLRKILANVRRHAL